MTNPVCPKGPYEGEQHIRCEERHSLFSSKLKLNAFGWRAKWLLIAGLAALGVQASVYTVTLPQGATNTLEEAFMMGCVTSDVVGETATLAGLYAASDLRVKGAGRLEIATDLKAAGYAGEIHVENGAVLRVTVTGALGDTVDGTFVADGATLEAYTAGSVWTATNPTPWAAESGAITLTREADGGFAFRHTGTMNWCVNAIEPIAAHVGDQFTLTCVRTPLEGTTIAQGPIKLGVVLQGEDGKTISWAFAERAVMSNETASVQFVVPADVERLYVRFRGLGACAGRIRSLRLERTGSVLPSDYAVPPDVTLSCGSLDVTVPGEKLGFRVRDRRTGRTWEPQSFSTGYLLATQIVREEGQNAIRATYLDLLTQETVTVRFLPEVDRAEIHVTVEAALGDGVPLDFPPVLASRAGERLVLPLSKNLKTGPARWTSHHGGHLERPYFGVVDETTGAGMACFFETPDAACVRVVQATPFSAGPSWSAVRHAAYTPRRARYVFFAQGGEAEIRAQYDKDVFDGDPGAARGVPPGTGFFLRDVAADGGWTQIAPAATVNGLRLDVTTAVAQGGTSFDVTLTETSGVDRAVTLVYAIALAADDDPITWFETLRGGEELMVGERSRTVAQGTAGRGWMSWWPFGAVAQHGNGLALGLDPAAPAFYRIAVNATTRQLYIAFDLGFAEEHPSAHVRFNTYSFAAADGLRGALSQYRRLFPEAFHVRCPQQGVWTVHNSITNLPFMEDFGFRFRGRTRETAWDDAHDILSFHYSEPGTWWVSVPKAVSGEPYTLADGVAVCERMLAEETPMALAWKNSVMHDEDGMPAGTCSLQSWCKGVVWSHNSAPGISGGRTNDFTVKIDPDTFDVRYAQPFPQGIDGEYMDTAELDNAPWCDYRRDHFAGMATPLAFARDSKRPVIHKGLVSYEYIREVARLSHGKGRLTLTNCTPIKWWWLTPFLDILGSETWWLKDDGEGGWAWKPMSDEELMYRRALCGGKPFCFLMDAPFDHFPYEMTEKYMQRSLAYGVFPGFFIWHGVTATESDMYFSRPELYERDRPLFKKYVPLCKQLSEAGWQVINHVTASDSPEVITEQFGEFGDETCYATVFNLSDQVQNVQLQVLVPNVSQLEELVTGVTVSVADGICTFALQPESVRVLRFAGQ